jgi:hypothetical protein
MPATFGSAKLISSGYRDVYISQLDTNGIFIWTFAGGGTARDVGYDVAADGKGGAVATGHFGYQKGGGATLGGDKLTSQGLGDIFVWRVE